MVAGCSLQRGRSGGPSRLATGIYTGGTPSFSQSTKGGHQSGIRPARILHSMALCQQNRRVFPFDLHHGRRRLGPGRAGCYGDCQQHRWPLAGRSRGTPPHSERIRWRGRPRFVQKRCQNCSRVALPTRYHHCSLHDLRSSPGHVPGSKTRSKPHGKSYRRNRHSIGEGMAQSFQCFSGSLYQIGGWISKFLLSGTFVEVHIVSFANDRNGIIQQSQSILGPGYCNQDPGLLGSRVGDFESADKSKTVYRRKVRRCHGETKESVFPPLKERQSYDITYII
mmetsp:Transcript_23947/g.52354  ORF Transcript_23947/g.52354 Transcript_23947/m.52354 type:complete len:280 (+) Transcript_23947:631-1470(+)